MRISSQPTVTSPSFLQSPQAHPQRVYSKNQPASAIRFSQLKRSKSLLVTIFSAMAFALSAVQYTAPGKQKSPANAPQKISTKEDREMTALAEKHPVLKKLFGLIDIPSATPQPNPQFQKAIAENMDKVRDLITQYGKEVGITQIERNQYGSLILRVPGSPDYEDASPLMFTAHMDIVPGDPENPTRAVIRTLKTIHGKTYLCSDGTTTLGADDKSGIAGILQMVANLKNKPHVPVEILFSPDEESSLASLKALDTSQFKAQNVVVVDSFDDLSVTTGLASAVFISIDLQGTNGGHSGEDINKPNRGNAIFFISDLIQKLGTGVIETDPQHPSFPLLSKNLGMIEGGSAPNSIPTAVTLKYLLRSATKEAQQKELTRMQTVIADFQTKYQPTQPHLQINMTINEAYPPYQIKPTSILPKLCQKAIEKIKDQKVTVGPIHAAAQSSILANKTNAQGKQFQSVLVGAHIEEAHTKNEKLDIQSEIMLPQVLTQIVEDYTQQHP